MGRYSNKAYCSPLSLCDISPEGFLLIMAGFVLYMAIAHLYNWLVFYCVYTFIPFFVLLCLYFVASAVLFFGVVYSVRGLITGFIWIMIICLVANVVYAVMIYIDQRCLCDNLHWMTQNFNFYITIISVYGLLGFLSGVNFVITLLCVMIVSEYLRGDAALV